MKIRGLLLAVAVLSAAPLARAMDLREYIDEVVKKHHGLESLRAAREGAEFKRVSGDLSLVPTLNLRGSYLSDKKEPNQLGADESRMTSYSASLNQKFSSGTNVTLSASTVGYENVNISSPLFSSFAQYGAGGLGISVSQSLWKDAFGRSTRLRRERESVTAQAEVGGYDLQARQILSDAEALYWDWLSAQEEMRIRRASLERAQKIDNWLRRRVADGIADRADALSAEALVASRKLQLANAEDDMVALEKKLRDMLELGPNEALPNLAGNLSAVRAPTSLVDAGEGKIVRLDAWLASLDAKAREVGAREAEDGTRADLNLSGSYNTNSYAPGGTAADGTKDWTKTNTPTAQVALTWTYLFDTDVKASVASSARQAALSSKLQAERKLRESETAWSEVNRRHRELSKKIESAASIRRIQADRAKAQATKLERGRAITTDVINSEQDAAEADLQWMKLQAEQRKLESQSRLFVTVKE